MRKLATKLTPAIKAWIKEELGSDYYDGKSEEDYFSFPNFTDFKGFKIGSHMNVRKGYLLVSEQEFLKEFGKPKPIIFDYGTLQYWDGKGWCDTKNKYRIKPTPDYSKEIEALQEKAKENGMKVTINFEKL